MVSKSPLHCRVRLLQKKYNSVIKSVFGKQIAVAVPSKVLIPVGTRVVAIFHDMENYEKVMEKLDASNFYSGVIAEPPKSTNKYRLIITRNIFWMIFIFSNYFKNYSYASMMLTYQILGVL